MKKSTFFTIVALVCGLGAYALEAFGFPSVVRWIGVLASLGFFYFAYDAKKDEKAAAIWDEEESNG